MVKVMIYVHYDCGKTFPKKLRVLDGKVKADTFYWFSDFNVSIGF